MKLRLAFAMGGLILALGGGIAAATAAFDPLAIEHSLEPSDAPALLGPIAVEGRVGWACEPEKAAEATRIRDARLPILPPAR